MDRATDIINFTWLWLEDAAQYTETFAGWLSDDERMKAAKFHFSVDRERFTLGRGFIRALSAAHLQIHPKAVVFSVTDTGKPYLKEGGLEFNVSHSGRGVLIAWSDGAAIGADVEMMDFKTTETLKEIAQISFSTNECAVLSAASESEKAPTFYRIWVRKEAIIKAEGVGLGGPLQAFSVVNLKSGVATWVDEVPYPDSDRIWKLVDLKAPQGHLAALAIPQGARVEQGSNALLNSRW